MYPEIALRIFFRSLITIFCISLLSSCVNSLYIGSAQSEWDGYQISNQSGADQLRATRANYLVFQEASTQTIYDHRKGLSAKQQSSQSDLKAETHRNPKLLKRINQLEKKASKRAKQHLKADLKEMRAQAKLDSARRKAGLQAITFSPYYYYPSHDHRCRHK